jgi:hypothetical protein
VSINFDFSEIDKLAADLGEVPAKIRPNVRKAVEVTARHVKDDWRVPVSGSQSVPGGARTISYDVTSGPDGAEAEIGPEIGGPGALVGMLEYGTPTVGPTGYGHAALQKNEDDFVKGLEIASEIEL